MIANEAGKYYFQRVYMVSLMSYLYIYIKYKKESVNIYNTQFPKDKDVYGYIWPKIHISR